MPRRRIIRRNSSRVKLRDYAGRTAVSFSVPKARGRGKRLITFRAAPGVKKGETVTIMAKNRRRKVARRRNASVASRRRRTASGRFKKLSANRRRKARKNPSRRKKVVRNKRRTVRRRRPLLRNKRRTVRKRVVRNKRRKNPSRRRRVVRNKRRKNPSRRRRVVRNKRRKSPARRRKVVRNKRRKNPTRRRAVRRNRKSRRRNGIMRSFRRNPSGVIMQWVRTGGFIAAGVVSHKLLSGLLKSMLTSRTPTATPDAEPTPAAGLGLLPASLAPWAGTISGAIAAAAGVYLVNKTVKDSQTRQLVAGGMVASFLHTLLVDILRTKAPKFAVQISGLGSDANAVRLSAMYGVGGATSIEPMYRQINGMGEYFSSGVNGLGEYFSSGVNGLGSPDYAAAGMGEYFSSGVSGLGEYGSNPDLMQAAAGYGAVDMGGNSNHLDPSSNLDHALTIAEAAAGVGSLGPMQAAAGLGNVSTVRSSQTWIPGESDPRIWAGVRPVDRSQEATAMIPAGSLQSGGGQGIFG